MRLIVHLVMIEMFLVRGCLQGIVEVADAMPEAHTVPDGDMTHLYRDERLEGRSPVFTLIKGGADHERLGRLTAIFDENTCLRPSHPEKSKRA